MKLINSSLTVLVCISAVYSAAVREGSDDLLSLLKDAFEMNIPRDHVESALLSEMDVEPARILETVRPTAECKATEVVVNSADFSNTTPQPNQREPADVTEERSNESSNSDGRITERASAEDSKEADRYRRSQLRKALADTHVALQEHYENSAESMSMDRTDEDAGVTEGSKKPIREATVVEDVSSQEIENSRNRPTRTKMRSEKHNPTVTGTDRQILDFMKVIDHINHSLASRMNLKVQAGEPHDADKHKRENRRIDTDFDSPEFVDTPDRPDQDADSEEHGPSLRQISGIKARLNYAANQATLDDSRELADGIPGCTETSVEHHMDENDSLDVPSVNQPIQKDAMSHERQPKECER